MLIADVDCTADGKDACDKSGVSGYPTIKYYTPETGKDGEKYQGGRSFEDLDTFVKEKLAKKCDVATKSDCDDKQKDYIDKQTSKGLEKVSAELKRLTGMKSGDMVPDKKAWLMKRIAILQDLEKKMKDEL